MKIVQLQQNKTRKKAIVRSLLYSVAYAVFGYLWVIISEIILTKMHPESPEVFLISISKGLGYVTITATLLFLLIYSNIKRILHEIKERLANETALNEAQEMAQVGSFSYHASLNVFHCSNEAMRILDTQDCNITSSDFSEILRRVHSSDRERVYTLASETYTRGGEASFYCRILRANESERTIHVQIHAERQDENGQPYLIGTLQDVTERIHAEAAARENEAIYKALINSSYDLVYFKDSFLRYIAVNSNMERYYGLREEQLLGKTISAIKPGKDARIWEARDRSVLISGKPLYIEDVEGDKTFETIIFPVNMSGSKRGVGGISRDITQRYQAEAAIKQERDRAKAYFEIAPVIFIVLDQNGLVTMINKSGCDMLQISRDQIVGQNWIDRFVPENDRAELQELFSQIQSRTANILRTHENDIIISSGVLRRIEWRNTILENSDGSFQGILSAGVDVTELRQANEALRESERSKSVLLSNLPGMAYRCAFDKDWTMSFVSSGCYELTGYLPEEIVNNACISFNNIICPEYREPIRNESIEHFSNQMGNRYEYEILTASGERKWVLDVNQGIMDSSGTVYALEGIILDITKSKLQFLQIQYLSNHDQLTGLHNRQYYDNAMRSLDDNNHLPISIIFVDINGLKLVNDAFGYDAGDKMIQTTGSLLKGALLPREVIARIGGDEFAILLPNTDSALCIERAAAFRTVIDNFNATIKDRALVINLSIGYSTKSNAEDDMSRVVKNAEANLARKKLFDQKSHHNAVLSSIMVTLFERSFETEEHASRIGDLCVIIGERLGLSHDEMDKLRLFAILHDIGKIGISDQILNKPGSLTDEEMAVMKTHPEIGYRIAMASPDFAPVADYILTHQEKWDGTGYPNHLAGENIPLLSRILAVADAYDAMTKDRVYRKALPKEVALEEIRQNAGTQFDPKIAALFIELVKERNL